MKIQDILLEEQQLNEINFKKALASGIAAAGLMGAVGKGVEKLHPDPVAARPAATVSHKQDQSIDVPDRVGNALQQLQSKYKLTPEEAKEVAQVSHKYDVAPEITMKALDIVDRYKIDLDLAIETVKLAHKYQKATYPKANDILAVIGIESSFDPDSVSGLRKDPAVGLMQTRPVMWGVDPSELQGDIEAQIRLGSDILHKYYQKIKDPIGALKAYNVGLSNYRNGERQDAQDRYASKYQKERSNYSAKL